MEDIKDMMYGTMAWSLSASPAMFLRDDLTTSVLHVSPWVDNMRSGGSNRGFGFNELWTICVNAREFLPEFMKKPTFLMNKNRDSFHEQNYTTSKSQ